jgi:Arc/MetJ-type ribon-helix-helix transcriptional regulator
MSTLNNIKKKMGRPPVDSEAVTVRMERSLLDALDRWREAQPDVPSRPEAIRRGVTEWLKAM